MQPELTIYCLGEFEIDGLSIQPRGLKQTVLLAYLATNLGRPCARSVLASTLWADRFDSQARQSLRQALSSLRKAFKACPGSLQIDRNSVWLNPELVRVDVMDALSAMDDGKLEQAASLFRRGRFLEELVARETGLADWLAPERARWAERARQAILDRAEQLLGDSRPVAAEEMIGWLLRQDPFDETAVRLAMKAKEASGSVSAAVRLFRQLESTLRDELGVPPSRETMNCLEEVSRACSEPAASLAFPPACGDHRPRVLVLPLSDIHAGPEGSAIADSLTDEVISALGRFPELAVIGRNTSIIYRDAPRDLPGLVRDLDIQYVVSGTVRRLGDRLRISVELDDAVAQEFVSSERRDCRIEDFYEVQDDLAHAIAGAMEPELISAETRKQINRPIGSLEFWEKALVARGHFERGTKESIFTAENVAAEILQEDPDQLVALKVLANAHFAMVYNFWVDDLIATAENSLSFSERVLELDQFDADALSIAARCHMPLQNFDRALQLAECAVGMNPSNAQSRVFLGSSYSNLGRFHEGLTFIGEARRMSPRDRFASYWDCAESYAHFGLGNLDEVLILAGASAKKPSAWVWTHLVLAVTLVQTNQLDEAAKEVKKLRSDDPKLTCERINLLLPPVFDRDFTSCLKRVGLPEK